MKEEIIKYISQHKIIAIVRGIYGEECKKLAYALQAGGISLLEVTFDQNDSASVFRTADTIRMLNDTEDLHMYVGAGTVTTHEMCQLAKNAGAQFVISPNTEKAIIQQTAEYGMVSIPGAMTPTEIIKAYEYGADFVKVFPVSELGVSYVKAIRSPLNHIRMLAVGGVNEHNISQFLKAGMVGVGVGGNLVNKKWIAEGKFDQITKMAEEFVKAAKEVICNE